MWSEKEAHSPIRGISFTLTGFPVFVLMIVALMNPSGAGVPGGTAICNIGTGGGGCSTVTVPAGGTLSSVTCTSGFNYCFSGNLPPYTVISCSTSDVPISGFPLNGQAACLLVGPGICYAASPFICSTYGQGLNTYILSGVSVTTGASTGQGTACQTCATTPNSNSYSILNDWTVVMIALTAAAAIASITVFAIGLNTEAVHIIYMMTGMLVIWTILTVVSGFGNATSFWGQMNTAGNFSMGNILYAVLSLVYFISALKGVSRGGS